MRVLITDFMKESDFEREVLPGVKVDALLALLGHAPTAADLVRAAKERPTEVGACRIFAVTRRAW